MSKPCEYCGVDLPLGVDKGTRRVRSFHFASCEKRPQTTPHSQDLEAQRDALLEACRFYASMMGRRKSDGEPFYMTALDLDCGDRARAAIAKAEGEKT